MKQPIHAIAVVGPTASGKTAQAIALATRLSGEIVSADSMQIYREMEIGTAKPTAEERRRAVHHLIDFLPPNAPYSAADYAVDALRAAREIHARGHLPVFSGGTGLYLEAVRSGRHAAMPDVKNEAFRASCLEKAESEDGKDALWQELYAVDPISAAATHKNNVRRVIRALEIYKETGEAKSVWDARSKQESPDITLLPILLDFHDRALLYERIERRADAMLDAGLIAETERLYRDGHLLPDTTAAQAIAYKELLPCIRGEMSLADAVAALKTATRRYAKRQLTWFHAMKDAVTVYIDGEDGNMRNADEVTNEMLALAEAFLKNTAI